MPKNTFVLVALLAIFAALVVGVNIGKRFTQPIASPSTPTINPQPSELSPTSLPKRAAYTSQQCGISFEYPENFIKQEASQSAGAVFVAPERSADVIMVTCQKDIPRPALSPEKIETIAIGSNSAKLYHDASAKDGAPVDKLIFRHPKTGLDIFLAGLGTSFQQAVASLKILQ